MNPADLSKLLPRLRATALYALGDQNLAQDVAQEAVARALARAPELPEPEKVPAFLAGIARHIITDHIRARRRLEVVIDDVDIPHAYPDALATLLADERRAQLRIALQKLSAEDREVLRLSYDEGLGPAEIATRLNQPHTAVRKRKSRAIERLRAIMLQFEAVDERSHKGAAVPTEKKESTITYDEGDTIAAEL